jgi:hypothetical protein
VRTSGIPASPCKAAPAPIHLHIVGVCFAR